MIKITVELISAISPLRNRVLGVATISNDGTKTGNLANYNYKLFKKIPKGKLKGAIYKQGRIVDFPKKRLLAWDLLYEVLKAAIGDRR